jgi:hypothetical protein
MMLLYGGPDQVMGVASALATAAGIALMSWNKVLVFVGKVLNRFKPKLETANSPDKNQ